MFEKLAILNSISSTVLLALRSTTQSSRKPESEIEMYYAITYIMNCAQYYAYAHNYNTYDSLGVYALISVM